MEPRGSKPDDVQYGINRTTERFHDVTVTIRCVQAAHVGIAHQLGEHHVIPEIVRVQNHAQHNDDAQHQHVL